MPSNVPSTPNGPGTGRIRGFILVLTALFLEVVSLSGGATPPGTGVPGVSGWIVYWDAAEGMRTAKERVTSWEEISVFAADFDSSLRPLLSSWGGEALRTLKTDEPESPRVMLTVVNDVRGLNGPRLKDPDAVHELLSSDERRAEHIRQLIQLAPDADGLEIDYENLKLRDRESFSLFLRDLADKLHERGQRLAVDLEPRTSDVPKDGAGAVDWDAVGRYADDVKVMAYLYHYPSGPPGPIAPPDWVGEVARFALARIPPDKLTIALTTNGCDWPADGPGIQVKHRDVLRLEKVHSGRRSRDASSGSPILRYTDLGVSHVVWFEDAESLKKKTALLRDIGIRRIAFWQLGSGDPAFWKTLDAWK